MLSFAVGIRINMNYAETLNYLYQHLPMFARIGAPALKKDLSNTLELCSRLGNPHQQFKSIHIGGTNGKGSTSHMLAAILQQAGYKTGLYTSPHLRDFRERIRINGQMIPETEVIKFVQQQRRNIEEIKPSFFEATAAMAFDYFARQKVDIAVIEVGLGGRLDSTNIITPLLSLITNISFDHSQILGNTLPEIALEKAGIIKPGVPVIISQRQPAIEDVFIKKAAETGSKLIFASDEWNVEAESWKTYDGDRKLKAGSLKSEIRDLLNVTAQKEVRPQASGFNLQLDLTGTYQLKNLPGVLSAVDQLRRQGFSITDKHLVEAFKKVKELTGLKGRWEILGRNPLLICDTGHNEDGFREILKNIEAVPYKKLRMVIGMVKDKAVDKVLILLPKNAVYYFCMPDIERGKPAEELMNEAAVCGLNGKSYQSVKDALKTAKADADVEDLIFIGGSTFVVAEII